MTTSPALKVASWNVNSLKVRLPQVLEWLDANAIDVLAVQETKTQDDAFPTDIIQEAGFDVAFTGQKTYNGMAVISRQPIDTDNLHINMPHWPDEQRRVLACTINGLRLINFYVPNGASTDSPKFTYKLEWLDQAKHWLNEELKAHEQVMVVGDFNIAPEDRDVFDPEVYEGIAVTPPERERFQAILDLGFQDCFRLFDQEEKSFSWWDYRQGGFRRNRGLRIDLILANPTLQQRTQQCYIDLEPRRAERPSDHAPVVIELTP